MKAPRPGRPVVNGPSPAKRGEFRGKTAKEVTASLRARNPYQVFVKDYYTRMKRGEFHRPEALGVDSWGYSSGARTFGFKTAEEATAFRKTWGLAGE